MFQCSMPTPSYQKGLGKDFFGKKTLAGLPTISLGNSFFATNSRTGVNGPPEVVCRLVDICLVVDICFNFDQINHIKQPFKVSTPPDKKTFSWLFIHFYSKCSWLFQGTTSIL